VPRFRGVPRRFRGLLVAVAILAAPACAQRAAPAAAPGPFDFIPPRWVDLPEAPFVAEMRGGRALLVARGSQTFSSVTVGCVMPVDGRTDVIAELTGTINIHGAFGPRSPAALLSSLNNPQISAHLTEAKHCPADSYLAITSAVRKGTAKPTTWTAQGTRWPRRR
jgi:hypothetical protein